MLTLLTEGRNYPHAAAFLEFLPEVPQPQTIALCVFFPLLSLFFFLLPRLTPFFQQDSYRSVNADQWMSFLDFATSVAPDFSNYDENMAWPVMLDEYVSWAQG